MSPHRYIVALLLGLGGCVDADPMNQAGLWRPTGANALNIAAMSARPQDLIKGRGDAGSSGLMSAAAVSRLQQGRPKPLLTINAGTELGGDAGGAAPPAPAAP